MKHLTELFLFKKQAALYLYAYFYVPISGHLIEKLEQ